MLIRFLWRWGLSALLLIVVSFVVKGVDATFIGAIAAALVLGLLSAIVRPILILLTLPITVITFGLFIFVINALLFWMAALLVPGFTVHGVWAALVGAFLYAVLGALLHITLNLAEPKRADQR